jgi:hypothetical protein
MFIPDPFFDAESKNEACLGPQTNPIKAPPTTVLIYDRHRQNSGGARGSPLVDQTICPFMLFGHGSGQLVGEIRSYSG